MSEDKMRILHIMIDSTLDLHSLWLLCLLTITSVSPSADENLQEKYR